jgi:putative acyl-CoA dehydrogenase
VRANTTVAKPLDPSRSGSGHAFSLTGHKWFTSAPMSDGFLTLSNTLDDKVRVQVVFVWNSG